MFLGIMLIAAVIMALIGYFLGVSTVEGEKLVEWVFKAHFH